MEHIVMRKLGRLVALSENVKEQRKELRSFVLFLKEYAGKDRTLHQLLKLLADKYGKMAPERQRLSVLLSLCLYDMVSSGKGEKAAAACAKLVPGLKRKEGWGWSEAVYGYLGGGKSLSNPMLKEVCQGHCINRLFEMNISLYALGMEMSVNEKIFCYREPGGSIVLLGVNHQWGDILCDESSMNGEPPLYFTADTHFVSPLYQLQRMRDILTQVLCQQGYPYVRIKLKVFYESVEASLINKEDCEEYWAKRDMECMLYKDCRCSPLKGNVFDGWDLSVFPDVLVWSLAITRAVYDAMPADKCYTLKSIRKYIRAMAKDSIPG